MKSFAPLLLILVPAIAHCDYVTHSADLSEYRVYDESIQAYAQQDEKIVTYYTRSTYKPTRDMAGNIHTEVNSSQNYFNCKTKYIASRSNPKYTLPDPEWSLPDSIGRAGGEYACSKAKFPIPVTPIATPPAVNDPIHKKLACITDKDCNNGLMCTSKADGGSECTEKKIPAVIAPISQEMLCVTNDDCDHGLHCRSIPNGGSECR